MVPISSVGEQSIMQFLQLFLSDSCYHSQDWVISLRFHLTFSSSFVNNFFTNPPLLVLSFCSCDNAYHKQQACFILYKNTKTRP